MTVIGEADSIMLGSAAVDRVYLGETLVWGTTGPWTPKSLPGLAMWFDASQLGLADDAEVSPWPDLSGNDRHGVIFGTPAPKVVKGGRNGRDVVRFTFNQGRVRVANSGVDLAHTIIYVSRMIGPNFGRIVCAAYPPPNFLLGWWNGYMDVGYSTSGAFFSPDVKKPANAEGTPSPWIMYSGDADAPPDYYPRLLRDGVLLSAGASGGNGGSGDSLSGTFNISGYSPTGAEETSDCEVAEIVVYNRKLSDAERQQVEQYLRDKWTPPADVDGLGLWLDASDLGGFADGEQVSSWPDKSQSGFHATSVSAASDPVYRTGLSPNGKPAIQFTASPYRMLDIRGWGTWLSGRNSYSLLMVLRPTDTYGDYPIILTAPTGSVWNFLVEYHTDGTVYWGHQNGFFRRMASAQPLTQWKVMECVMEANGTPHFYFNGVEASVASYGASGDIKPVVPFLGADVRLGAYYNSTFGLRGEVAEIMAYDHALTTAERQRVEQYLLNKWGVT